MIRIRPLTDLRNKFSEISRIVHDQNEPVFLTKNGHGDMVVMSLEVYEEMQVEKKILEKLKASSNEAANSDERLDFDDVSKEMREKLIGMLRDKNVAISN